MRAALALVWRFAGLGSGRTSHMEKWLSLAGGLAGVLAVVLISQETLGLDGSAGLVASMGASAVLLFAVPHGPLSQPWPLLGGHLVSAFVGVACAKAIAQPPLAAATAVALAIGAMHYLRCIHPPGGATALSAVIGGQAVSDLGFQFVLTPVSLNTGTILVIALLFNYPFPWRRYPSALARRRSQVRANGSGQRGLNAAAPTSPVSTTEASAGEPAHGGSLGFETSDREVVRPDSIRLGACYCNGAYGQDWQVRRVATIAQRGGTLGKDRREDLVAYEVAAGKGRRTRGTVTLGTFADWANYEVYLNENSWQRVAPGSLRH